VLVAHLRRGAVKYWANAVLGRTATIWLSFSPNLGEESRSLRRSAGIPNLSRLETGSEAKDGKRSAREHGERVSITDDLTCKLAVKQRPATTSRRRYVDVAGGS
jgi:hypothetical protein